MNMNSAASAASASLRSAAPETVTGACGLIGMIVPDGFGDGCWAYLLVPRGMQPGWPQWFEDRADARAALVKAAARVTAERRT